MARRRSPGAGVDMFPFLSVLCSVIGVLMLFMMITIGTRVIDAEQRATRPPDLQSNKKGIEDGIKSDEYRRLELEITRLDGLLRARNDERDEVDKMIRELLVVVRQKRELLAQPDAKRKKPVVLDRREKVQMIPTNAATIGLTPVYVEVTRKGYLVQPEKLFFPAIERFGEGKNTRVTADRELAAFVGSFTRRPKEFLVFLIHPHGIEAYENMEIYILKNHSKPKEIRRVRVGDKVLVQSRLVPTLKYGKEPFSKDWEFIRGEK